jgi:hypothetical protein
MGGGLGAARPSGRSGVNVDPDDSRAGSRGKAVVSQGLAGRQCVRILQPLAAHVMTLTRFAFHGFEATAGGCSRRSHHGSSSPISARKWSMNSRALAAWLRPGKRTA